MHFRGFAMSSMKNASLKKENGENCHAQDLSCCWRNAMPQQRKMSRLSYPKNIICHPEKCSLRLPCRANRVLPRTHSSLEGVSGSEHFGIRAEDPMAQTTFAASHEISHINTIAFRIEI